jgi:hypothetical protein
MPLMSLSPSSLLIPKHFQKKKILYEKKEDAKLKISGSKNFIYSLLFEEDRAERRV